MKFLDFALRIKSHMKTLTLIHSDMRAFDVSEHNLCDDDGVLLVTVRRIE